MNTPAPEVTVTLEKVPAETAGGRQGAAAATEVASATEQGANCRLRSASLGSWQPARRCCARPRSVRLRLPVRPHRRERRRRHRVTSEAQQLAARPTGAVLPRLQRWTP